MQALSVILLWFQLYVWYWRSSKIQTTCDLRWAPSYLVPESSQQQLNLRLPIAIANWKWSSSAKVYSAFLIWNKLRCWHVLFNKHVYCSILMRVKTPKLTVVLFILYYTGYLSLRILYVNVCAVHLTTTDCVMLDFKHYISAIPLLALMTWREQLGSKWICWKNYDVLLISTLWSDIQQN